MIALLDRPRTGVEIASALDVTLQRVRQLVVQLSAQGLVQVADPDQPLRAVWRTGDKVVVLNATAAKVLSAVPERRGTTSHKVAVATRRPIEEVKRALSELVRRRFVLREADVFSLTRAGADHWQRRPNARRAGATPLPVKSDRVQKVLAYLLEHGPTRTRDVGQALGVARASMNALMQYLKRKGLVKKSSGGLNAPHELTHAGRKTLGDLRLDLAA